MRKSSLILTVLAASVASAGAMTAQAATGVFYDPANAASSSGKTSGFELYGTIGCPGRQLLDAPCPVPKPVDSDGDGVVDGKDKCPGTPAGRKVNADGCELDSDGDGVVDALDKCPGTPAGRKVNADGCELDSDGDGVVDGLDKCPGTPAGRKVNADGCELDSDGDGVVDALDKCPGTPAGRKVNADGCELDSDGDGIVDGADKCPTVAARTADGCPPALVLHGVNFDNNEAVLRLDAYPILDEAAQGLKTWGDVRIEVAGHTDNVGTDEHNIDLSQRRAEAVRAYLVGKGIAEDRITAKGYGESEPVADNDTAEGRFKNRRVELKPLN
jgi:outer membrane protein OmpA-like peptidoglycan-associated protein